MVIKFNYNYNNLASIISLFSISRSSGLCCEDTGSPSNENCILLTDVPISAENLWKTDSNLSSYTRYNYDV